MAKNNKVRYGVVGLGHIAQVAVLPAFKSAKKNSVLAALVTDDPVKAKKLAKKYKVENVYSYDQYDELLTTGVVDALYICLPNHMHTEYTLRALEAGIHVLCEKPLAPTAEECRKIDQAAKKANRRMMTAYRLHFEASSLEALKLVKAGKLGDLRYFTAEFSYQVTYINNIRLKKEAEGGPVWDIGIYCINAARALFQAEPQEVFAYAARRPGDKRFSEVPETVAVMMKFPDEKFANFTCSFGADTASTHTIRGTKGSVRVENAYEYAGARKLIFTKDGETEVTKNFKKADQFAPEVIYFSDCVLKSKDPEPSAREGMNDVKVIQAIYESIETSRPVKLKGSAPHKGPKLNQKKNVPGHALPELVNATGASN